MNLAVALGIFLLANALAVGAMLLVRHRAPDGSFFSEGDRASGVFSVLATGFAIFAGFVIFLAFTQYDNSRSGAEAEALAVAQQASNYVLGVVLFAVSLFFAGMSTKLGDVRLRKVLVDLG